MFNSDNYENIEIQDKKFVQSSLDFLNSLENKDILISEVVAKIVYYETVEPSSYRGMLYSRFGFPLNAYAAAQISGFIEIHNNFKTTLEPEVLKEISLKYEKIAKTTTEIQKLETQHQILIFCAVCYLILQKEIRIPFSILDIV